ncbi:hypothetical protein Tco_0786137 [Tanacetum coccineum]
MVNYKRVMESNWLHLKPIKRLRKEETPRIVGDDSARSEPTEVADSNNFKPLLKEKRLKEQTRKALAIQGTTNSEKENKPITCFEGNTDGYLEFVVEHGVEQKENIEVYCGTTFWRRTSNNEGNMEETTEKNKRRFEEQDLNN